MRRTGKGGAGEGERQRERKEGRAQAGVEGERGGGCKAAPPIGEDEAPSDPLPKAIGADERREGIAWTSRPKTGRPDVLPFSPPGNQACIQAPPPPRPPPSPGGFRTDSAPLPPAPPPPPRRPRPRAHRRTARLLGPCVMKDAELERL